MPEQETLTCHLASGPLSSQRVAALTFVMGISRCLVLVCGWVPLCSVTCAALASTHAPSLPPGLGTNDAGSTACSWCHVLAECSNSCAVRALGDDATPRSSAFCHYIAPQKGLSPSTRETHHLSLARDPGPTRVSLPTRIDVLICSQRAEGAAQPGLDTAQWQRHGNGSAVAQRCLGSGPGAARASGH